MKTKLAVESKARKIVDNLNFGNIGWLVNPEWNKEGARLCGGDRYLPRTVFQPSSDAATAERCSLSLEANQNRDKKRKQEGEIGYKVPRMSRVRSRRYYHENFDEMWLADVGLALSSAIFCEMHMTREKLNATSIA